MKYVPVVGNEFTADVDSFVWTCISVDENGVSGTRMCQGVVTAKLFDHETVFEVSNKPVVSLENILLCEIESTLERAYKKDETCVLSNNTIMAFELASRLIKGLHK